MDEKDKRIEFLEPDTDRLRDDQNEQKACSQQLYEELWENEEYGHREVNEEATAEASESSILESSESKSRISRREADKIVAPPSPKPHDLDGWKSQLLSNVLSACADTDQDAWTSWIGEALKLHGDKTGMGDSGGARFSKIDVKLSNALNAMFTSSGDSGREVGMQNKVMTLDLARRSPPKIVKARQIVAMILESFHSSTH